MGKHLEEKSLIVVNENSILYKIKLFFKNLFRRTKNVVKDSQIAFEEKDNIQSDKKKDTFMENIRKVEDEETKLLKLQQQYDKKLIETKDLPKDQIKSLIDLYKKQIMELSKSNEIRKQKLLEYRKKYKQIVKSN